MSTLDPTPTPLPAAPDWRALCQELRDAYAESQAIQHGPWVGSDHGPSPLLARVDAALATPPAATREAEHDDGDDAIDRWVDSKSDWIANWGAPRSDIAALIGEALDHWGHSTTREAGPLPQAGAGISTEEWYALKEQLWDQFETVGHQGERFMWFASFDAALDKARAVLARWGGAAVPSKAAPTDDDICDLADVFNGDPVPAIRRALELWGGATVPVPVSERPWEQPGWCDAEGRCWFGSERDGCIQAVWSMRMPIQRISHQRWCAPHWALPVPAAAAGEVE